ncbi:hypothetical protein HBI40_170510 [Parastagonospora nodorum]|nr:hypothetical protein HBI40_170510 [Parastagonospora nodorum]
MASTRVIHCCFYCIVLLWIQHAPNNSPTVIMTSWRLGGDIHLSSFIVLEVHHHPLPSTKHVHQICFTQTLCA